MRSSWIAMNAIGTGSLTAFIEKSKMIATRHLNYKHVHSLHNMQIQTLC